MLNSLENMWKNVYNLYHEDKSAIHVAYIKYLTEELPMTEEQKNAAPETAGEVKASEEPKTAPDTSDEPKAATSPETEAKEDKVKEEKSSSEEPQSERQKDFHFFKKEKPDKKIMDSYSSEDDEDGFSRDQWILSHLNEKDLMKYLELEQKRAEMSQQAKETREKRIFTAFQLTVSLAAVVAVTYLLKDNPSILVSILYTIGIIAALWLWKKR